jgi:hypothetical protein
MLLALAATAWLAWHLAHQATLGPRVVCDDLPLRQALQALTPGPWAAVLASAQAALLFAVHRALGSQPQPAAYAPWLRVLVTLALLLPLTLTLAPSRWGAALIAPALLATDPVRAHRWLPLAFLAPLSHPAWAAALPLLLLTLPTLPRQSRWWLAIVPAAVAGLAMAQAVHGVLVPGPLEACEDAVFRAQARTRTLPSPGLWGPLLAGVGLLMPRFGPPVEASSAVRRAVGVRLALALALTVLLARLVPLPFLQAESAALPRALGEAVARESAALPPGTQVALPWPLAGAVVDRVGVQLLPAIPRRDDPAPTLRASGTRLLVLDQASRERAMTRDGWQPVTQAWGAAWWLEPAETLRALPADHPANQARAGCGVCDEPIVTWETPPARLCRVTLRPTDRRLEACLRLLAPTVLPGALEARGEHRRLRMGTPDALLHPRVMGALGGDWILVSTGPWLHPDPPAWLWDEGSMPLP